MPSEFAMEQGSDDVVSAVASSNDQNTHTSMSPDSLGKRKRNDEVETFPKREISSSPLFTLGEDANMLRDDESDADPDEDFDDPIEVLWSEEQEPLPVLPIYHPDIASIEKDLLVAILKIKEIIDAHECSADSIGTITAKISDLSSIPVTKPIRIGLLGDAGVGKSSTINSLLDIVGIAREGSTGQSCTFVVTEYRSPFQGQVLPFAAKLQYATIDNVRSMLSELLEAYTMWESTCQEDWDKEKDIEDLRMQRDTALQTFLTLFCNKLEFKSDDAANTYLEETSNETIVETMVTWCKETLDQKPPDNEGYSECVEANSASELRALVDPTLSPIARNVGEPALWPLLAKVSIGLIGPRVLKNMVIADLPGVSDNNQVRVKATTDYIRTCDNLWLVARGDRVITDVNVDKWMQRYSDRFKGKTTVICTRSDEISDPSGLARDLEEFGYDLSEYKELAAVSRALSSRINGMNVRLNNLAKASSNNHKKKLQFMEARVDLESQKAAVNNLKFESVVKTKNQRVIAILQQEKQVHVPDDKLLEVHCISNREYSHLKGISSTDPVHLRAEATGIPGLRSYALTLPALAAMGALEGYMSHAHPAFLNGLLLWTQRVPVRNYEKLLDIVAAPQKELDKLFDAHTIQVETKFDQRLKDPFARHQSSFVDHARSKVTSLRNDWHWCTFKAFLFRNGKHVTPKKPPQSWNDDFLQPPLKKIGNQWQVMDMEQRKSLKELEERCVQGLKDILPILETEIEAEGFAMDKLRDLIQAHCQGVRSAVAECSREYRKENANIKMDTFRDQERSYFLKHIKPVYKACRERKGTGFFDASIAGLDSFVSQRGSASPFAMVAKDAVGAAKKNARILNEKLNKRIRSIHAELYDQFTTMIEEDTDGGNVSDIKVRRAIAELLKEEMPKIEETKSRLEAIKASFRV